MRGKSEVRLTLNTLINYNLKYNKLKRTKSLKVSCGVVFTEPGSSGFPAEGSHYFTGVKFGTLEAHAL